MLAKPNISTNMGYPGLVVAYGANSAQNSMMACTNLPPPPEIPRRELSESKKKTDIIFCTADEWKNDPRNPHAKQGGNKAH